jgi:hypothetical protein
MHLTSICKCERIGEVVDGWRTKIAILKDFLWLEMSVAYFSDASYSPQYGVSVGGYMKQDQIEKIIFRRAQVSKDWQGRPTRVTISHPLNANYIRMRSHADSNGRIYRCSLFFHPRNSYNIPQSGV